MLQKLFEEEGNTGTIVVDLACWLTLKRMFQSCKAICPEPALCSQNVIKHLMEALMKFTALVPCYWPDLTEPLKLSEVFSCCRPVAPVHSNELEWSRGHVLRCRPGPMLLLLFLQFFLSITCDHRSGMWSSDCACSLQLPGRTSSNSTTARCFSVSNSSW